MGKKDLEAFINSKKEKVAQENKIDWGKKRDEWLKLIDAIYKEIEEWLHTYENNDAISFEYIDTEINEEHIGIYNTKKMLINIASEQILLEPIGTLLIGAKGRIDMKGKNGTIKLVVVPFESNAPQIKVSIVEGKETEEKEIPKPETNWVWKIATPPPSIKYIELNNDSFSDALLEVIGG